MSIPTGGNKRRGRPPKPRTEQTPYAEDLFDTFATSIVGIAKDRRLWQRTKEAVVAKADADRSLSPVSRIVLNFYLHHINRSEGRDWHSAATIAADRSRSIRSIERSNEELSRARYILRRPRRMKVFRASRPYETTIPAIVDAANSIKDPTGNSSRTRQENHQDPTGKSSEPDKKCSLGPDKFVGLTSRGLTPKGTCDRISSPRGLEGLFVGGEEGEFSSSIPTPRRPEPRMLPENIKHSLQAMKAERAKEAAEREARLSASAEKNREKVRRRWI